MDSTLMTLLFRKKHEKNYALTMLLFKVTMLLLFERNELHLDNVNFQSNYAKLFLCTYKTVLQRLYF